MNFEEMYLKFGRTAEDIRLDNLEKEAKDKEDVLYDIKDEPDVPAVQKQVEKTVDSQTKSNLSDDDINKIVELLASRINTTKEGEADGNQ